MSPLLRVVGLTALVVVACTRGVFSQTPERVGIEVLVESLVFAPGVISTEAFEYGTAFTPDGSTVYFTRRPSGAGSEAEPPNTIYESHLQNGAWTSPRVAFFSGTYDDRDPFISPDGERLFFTSDRPVVAGDSTQKEPDIWMIRRTEDGWGEPEHLDPPVNSPGAEYSPVTAANGTLYFASVRLGGQGQGDLYRSPLEDGAYRQVFPLNAPINSPTGEWSIEVDPRERFIIFDASQRAGNLSLFSDLYLAYRQADGSWGAPMNLRRLNSTGLNIFPRISPDGAHLYYSNTDSMGSANADLLVTPLGSLLRAYRAPAANDAVLVVANRSGHNVALIDPESYTLLGTLPVGKGPHEVAVSGSNVFVANYGIYPEVPDESAPRTLTWKTEVTNTITVLDMERRVVVATHHLENCTNPHGIAASGDGTRFWVTCENHEIVLELDAATGQPIKRWPTRQAHSHMMLHDGATQKLFVANGSAGSVTIINRSTDQVQVVPTGAGAEGMALAPDGRTLWVLNGQANTITLIDTKTNQVVKSMPSGGAFPIKIALMPDGSRAWIVHNASREISILDTQRFTPIEAIALDTTPLGLLLSPDGRRAFVSTPRSDEVMVFDVASRRLLHTFRPGLEPDGMAWLLLNNNP